MQQYLHEFHETKHIFLRFRADKKTKKVAAEAHKNLLKEQSSQASGKVLRASQKAKLRQENTFERQELVDNILREGAHYNIPKIHMISHYMKQISKYGALKQYSTDISEFLHKGFKDAYRQRNKVDATPQMITTCTRDYTFAMKDLAFKTWNHVRQETLPVQGLGL